MKHSILLAALAAALATPAQAQTFATTGPVQVDIAAANDLVGPITLTPDTPGDELLFRGRGFLAATVFVARVHPTKSGPAGVYPVPGLCFEGVQAFQWMTPERLVITDVNGDRIDDVVGISGARVEVLMGIGLSACR